MKTLLLLSAGLLPLAALAAEPAKAPEMETVIVGDREAAVGLYLLPWKEEAASDIDHPPHQYQLQALDAQQFRQQVEDEQANAAYRRVRLEPR